MTFDLGIVLVGLVVVFGAWHQKYYNDVRNSFLFMKLSHKFTRGSIAMGKLITMLSLFTVTSAICDPTTLASMRTDVPSTVRIGGVFPKMIYEDNAIDPNGVQYIASFLMAIREINNKTDGLHDCLLPNTKIEFAIGESKGPFIDDVRAAIKLCTEVFNSSRVDVTVGAHSNSASNAIAQIFNGYKMNQIAYGSTGSFLSYVGPYPYFFRTCADDAFQGYAIADIIQKHYGWSMVSTFFSTDSYGSDGIQQFTLQANKVGINVVSVHQFRAGLSDFTDIINNVKSRGTKIFVFFMSSKDAGRLLEKGYEMGLFVEGTQVIGSGAIFDGAISHMSANAPVQEIMKGVLSLTQNFAFNIPSLESFVDRWRKQNNTVTVDPITKVETCHSGTDDDGNFELYTGKLDGGQTLCTGLEFDKFAEDGSDISNFVPFVYDATLAAAYGLHKHIYVDGNNDFDGDELGSALSTNFGFTGVTGPVSFRLGDPATGFGYGDREEGMRFALQNFQPGLYCPIGRTGGFAPIGSWDVVNSYVHCVGCTEVYKTSNRKPPLDHPEPEIAGLQSIMSSLLVALAVISLIVIALFASVMFYYRNKKLVKASQPTMMYIVLTGGLLVSARVINGAQTLNDAVCVGNIWFGHLGFVIVFGALLIKTWRVHLIVNTTLRRVKITAQHVLIMMMVLVLTLMVYLAFMTAFGNPHRYFVKTDLGQLRTRLTPVCIDTIPAFSTTLFILEGAMLMQGGRLCWQTKDVPDAVNDSKNIAMAMYSIIFICAMVFPILFLIDLDPSVVVLIAGIGFAIANISAMAILFGPKALLLWQGAELDAKMGIVLPGGNKAGIGDSKVADTNNDKMEVPMYERDAHINFTKGSREENIKICKEQILKWQKLLLQIENRALMSSSTSHTASQVNRSSYEVDDQVRLMRDDELPEGEGLLTTTKDDVAPDV